MMKYFPDNGLARFITQLGYNLLRIRYLKANHMNGSSKHRVRAMEIQHARERRVIVELNVYRPDDPLSGPNELSLIKVFIGKTGDTKTSNRLPTPSR